MSRWTSLLLPFYCICTRYAHSSGKTVQPVQRSRSHGGLDSKSSCVALLGLIHQTSQKAPPGLPGLRLRRLNRRYKNFGGTHQPASIYRLDILRWVSNMLVHELTYREADFLVRVKAYVGINILVLEYGPVSQGVKPPSPNIFVCYLTDSSVPFCS